MMSEVAIEPRGMTALKASVDRAEKLPANTLLASSCTQEWDQWCDWVDIIGPGDWGDVHDK